MSQKYVLLGVNVDHAATLRQARYRDVERTCGSFVEPDPVFLALLAEQAGADGITAHLREDRRHLQERDAWRLRESIQTRLNLEMACTEAMVTFALELQPDSVCLVPENRREISTEGGLDVAAQVRRITEIVSRMSDAGICTSLFVDPDTAQIEAAASTRAPCVELHTGAFANAHPSRRREAELARLRRAAEHAKHLDLEINAGHGINFVNIADVLTIPHLHELNIGHSIFARAMLHGISEAVQTMKARMSKPC
ncbi:MAG: pyridoxine 5'-phosphate synthase [Puniceicoccales bacterium]|nr:pyridoxine 5'-phosphate synthase [Puniceicoccales bacterium]